MDLTVISILLISFSLECGAQVPNEQKKKLLRSSKCDKESGCIANQTNVNQHGNNFNAGSAGKTAPANKMKSEVKGKQKAKPKPKKNPKQNGKKKNKNSFWNDPFNSDSDSSALSNEDSDSSESYSDSNDSDSDSDSDSNSDSAWTDYSFGRGKKTFFKFSKGRIAIIKANSKKKPVKNAKKKKNRKAEDDGDNVGDFTLNLGENTVQRLKKYT